MINLLPDNDKREIRAAHTNVILLRYNLLLVIVAAFLLASCAIVYAALNAGKANAETTNQQNISRAAAYEPTKKQAEEYRKNLKVAKQILDNEVIYTDLVFAITNLLPKDTVLDDLMLNSSTFGANTIINAHAKNYEAATALKTAFENSELFQDVRFQAISATTGEGSNAQYPLSVTINVTIKGQKK